MLADLWSTYALRIRTPRLCLRLPDGEELAALAELAGRGVHGPDVRPFLTPWTEGTAQDRARSVLREHWSQLQSWDPTSWRLGLGVFLSPDGHRTGLTDLPVGMVTLRARDFAVVREVSTSSWLGLEHQGRGLGTEARAGLLTLAFDHLGARDATTEVFPDNHASQGVSRRLGYESDGISRDARGTEALVSDRLRLTSTRWAQVERAAVTVEGLDAALDMFLG
jgi:RimJ/RimL family protein N-acetyltransferase